MKKLRQILFWVHLIAGLTAGLAIAVMSFTGAALAFERQLIRLAERDARHITPPAENASRLPLEELLQRVHTARPDFRIDNVTIARDPNAAVTLGGPGNATLCVNPFTAEIREAKAPRMRAFMIAMRNWHTHLNAGFGETINATGNVVFLGLGLSGLWLWWPSVWKWRVLRPSIWFQPTARGRARDWNWHNVFGFWSLLVLMMIAATGVVMSYRSVNAWMFRLAGDPLPAPGPAPAAAAAAAAAVPPPRPAVRPPPPVITADYVTSVLSPLLATARADIPTWQEVALRLNPPNRAAASVDYSAAWPAFTTATFTFDRVSGQTKRGDSYTSASAGRRARMWVRLTHSGESFGWPGQLIAGLACLGGCMLVWTGFAMSWRRFFGRTAG